MHSIEPWGFCIVCAMDRKPCWQTAKVKIYFAIYAKWSSSECLRVIKEGCRKRYHREYRWQPPVRRRITRRMWSSLLLYYKWVKVTILHWRKKQRQSSKQYESGNIFLLGNTSKLITEQKPVAFMSCLKNCQIQKFRFLRTMWKNFARDVEYLLNLRNLNFTGNVY